MGALPERRWPATAGCQFTCAISPRECCSCCPCCYQRCCMTGLAWPASATAFCAGSPRLSTLCKFGKRGRRGVAHLHQSRHLSIWYVEP